MASSADSVKTELPTTEDTGTIAEDKHVKTKVSKTSQKTGFLKRLKKRLTAPHHHRLQARYATPATVKSKNSYLSCLEGIFVSREMAPRGDQELIIRYTVREVAIYSVYLFIITMSTLGVDSGTPFLFTEMMKTLFVDEPLGPMNPKTLPTSASVEDFWNYARNVIPKVLYDENIYGGKLSQRKLEDPEKYGILYENKLVGVPRLRQLRVRSDNCPVADNFRYLTRECYPPYAEEHEDTGDKNDNYWGGSGGKFQSAWQYQTEEELGGTYYEAALSRYSGAGAIQNLGKRQIETEEIIQNLFQHTWVMRGTRVVFFDFTVYNANVNLFCIVRIVWEFPATGGLTASWSFRTLRLIRYLTVFENYFVFPSEILFCAFTLYYLIQEIIEFIKMGFRQYVRDIYAWLDIMILIISVICIIFQIIQSIHLAESLKALRGSDDTFHDFETLGYWQTQLKNTIAILVFFAWIKVFKYISFNKTMIQLSATLSRCSQDIGGFAVMFFIVFFAFSQLGYLLFGSQVRDFRTFEDSTFTLLRLIVGEFNFRRIEAANRVLGPIFFLAYVFFIFFVLLNMFLAIMTDTYSEVKAEIQAQRNEFEFLDYIKRSINNFLGIFGRRNVQRDAEDAVKLAPADGQLTYDEIFKSLKRASFTDTEIKIFLSRFGLKPEGSLDEEDTQIILNSLEADGHLSSDGAANTTTQNNKTNSKQMVLKEKFIRMQKRIEDLEAGITGLIHKIVKLTERLRD